MAGNDNDDDAAYDQARALAEKALECYAKGDEAGGDELLEDAKAICMTAVQDIYEELEEDADSEHDPSNLTDDDE